RQPVTQPARRGAQHLDVVRLQAGLLAQLAIHRLDWRLVGIHPALRELPAVTMHPPRPEQAAVGMHQHDAYIGSITVRIDHDADSELTVTDSATRPGIRQATAPGAVRIDKRIGGAQNPRLAATTPRRYPGA